MAWRWVGFALIIFLTFESECKAVGSASSQRGHCDRLEVGWVCTQKAALEGCQNIEHASGAAAAYSNKGHCGLETRVPHGLYNNYNN